MNERKTEQLVRNYLTALGYYADATITIEEQSSDNPVVNDLFSSASKSGDGVGRPEFIITKEGHDVAIVIECKADPKNHENAEKEAIHYGTYLCEEYNVIAIGVSGQDETDIQTSFFAIWKDQKSAAEIDFTTFSTYIDFYNVFHEADGIKISEEDLLKYSRQLHVDMREQVKLKEEEKPLLVAAILLALDDDSFKNIYPHYITSKDLAKGVLEGIRETLNKDKIPARKVSVLMHQFNFIKLHKVLSNGKIEENPLKLFVSDIHKKVYPFIKKATKIDILGKFYSEFLRYAKGGDANGLGIVLTPSHITDLFSELAEVNRNSRVLDTCTGTGGFLISAMAKMLDDATTEAERQTIFNHGLVGVEMQSNMFALACANMIIRGDGKSNMYNNSAFNQSVSHHQCNVGLINPPYSQGGKETEMKFALHMLNNLSVGGIGIMIAPYSCFLNTKGKDTALDKKNLLKKHTLKAVMSMPDDLFYPVGVNTCIAVFEAHKKHDEKKETWFGYWKEDGFVKVKNQGRVDINDDFKNHIKNQWLTQYRNRVVIPEHSVLKCVNYKDEWVVEAHWNTDYTTIDEKDFKKKFVDYYSFLIKNK